MTASTAAQQGPLQAVTVAVLLASHPFRPLTLPLEVAACSLQVQHVPACPIAATCVVTWSVSSLAAYFLSACSAKLLVYEVTRSAWGQVVFSLGQLHFQPLTYSRFAP